MQTISLEGTSDATPVLDAVKAVLDWDRRGLHAAPADAPLAFVPKKWRGYACPAEGQVDRQFYELCLLEVLRASLQSGEAWSRGGRRYGSVDDLLIPLAEWRQVRDDCYRELGIAKSPDRWLARQCKRLAKTIDQATANLGEPRLHRRWAGSPQGTGGNGRPAVGGEALRGHRLKHA